MGLDDKKPAADSPTQTAAAALTGDEVLQDPLSVLLLDAAVLGASQLKAEFAALAEPLDDDVSARLTVVPAVPGSARLGQLRSYILPASAGMSGYAIRTRNVVISPDLDAENRFRDPVLRELGVKSGLMLPVQAEDASLCVLGAFRASPGGVPLDQIWFVENVSQMIVNLVGAAQGDSHGTADLPGRCARAVDSVRAKLDEFDQEEHRLARALGDQFADLRFSPRRHYPYTQRIAPLRGQRLPTWGEFEEVRCGDLSGGGVSLWLNRRPDFRELVVGLGRPPLMSHFVARVVHVREVRRSNATYFQVGCQFLRRVHL